VIVVLALAVAGLVAWMALAMRPNSANAAPPEGSTINRSGVDRANTGILTVVTSTDGTLLVADHYFMGG